MHNWKTAGDGYRTEIKENAVKWNKYTLLTTTEAEDLISSMMMDVGIEGIEIEDTYWLMISPSLPS